MDLKSIFDAAEGGALTYDQFVKATEKNKLVDLTEGKYVDKQKYTDDLADRDTRINTLNDTLAERDKDLDSLKSQLEAAGTDAEALNKVNADLSNLQKQYDKDIKDYQKQLHDQEYKYAVTEFANQQKFTSNAAKRDFISTLMGKDLKVENGTIIGGTDFVKVYSEENADAFVVDDPAPADPTPTDPKPTFVEPTNPEGGSGADVAFDFGFTGVRPHQK